MDGPWHTGAETRRNMAALRREPPRSCAGRTIRSRSRPQGPRGATYRRSAPGTKRCSSTPSITSTISRFTPTSTTGKTMRRRSSRAPNVWSRTRRPYQTRMQPGWPVTPPVLEGSVFGGGCAGGRRRPHLARQSRRPSAQRLPRPTLKVIAPIMTETGGAAWRQTIFYPFAQMSRFARGDVLRASIECET